MQQTAPERTALHDGFLNGKQFVVMGRDGAFCELFRALLAEMSVMHIRLPAKSPNLNAILERFFRSLKSECLEPMIFFDERSLRNTIREYLAHDHAERKKNKE